MDFTPTEGNSDRTIESLRLVSELTSRADALKEINLDGVELLIHEGKATNLTEIVAPFQPGPRRIRAQQTFIDVAGFSTYFKHFEIAGQTWIKGSFKDARAVAYMDYHEHDSPSWCEHQAILTSERTPQWLAVKNMCAQGYVSQQTFATFLDRYSSWVVTPDAADLAEAVMMLEGAGTSKWSSKVNRSTGNFKFSLEEESTTNVILPTAMTFEVAPFYHSQEVEVTVKIRFKISPKDGIPTFATEIDNPEKIEYDALVSTFLLVEEATGMKVLIGP